MAGLGLSPQLPQRMSLANSPWPVQNQSVLPNSPYPQQVGMPRLGALFGKSSLNQSIAPRVPRGAPRPLSPGEHIQNPGGSWSSEITTTVPHPTATGKWTNLPTVWIINGQPRRLTEEEAIAAAKQSGLKWSSYDSSEAADKAAVAREALWQMLKPEQAVSIPPLWEE